MGKYETETFNLPYLPYLQGNRERKATWRGDPVLVELIYWGQAWLLFFGYNHHFCEIAIPCNIGIGIGTSGLGLDRVYSMPT